MAASSKKKPTKTVLNRRSRRDPADDFVAVARRIGADEDRATFETKLGKIAKVIPEVRAHRVRRGAKKPTG